MIDDAKLEAALAKVKLAREAEALAYKAATHLVEAVHKGAKQATKYLSPKLTIKATRQGKMRKGERQMTIVVTIGRPNYAEREFIRQAIKAGEPFPIRKSLLKYESKRKAA